MVQWLVLAALLATPRPPRTSPQGPPVTQPMAPEEARRRAEAYLGSIDTPVSAEQWKALGPAAADVLEPIVKGADEMPTRRAHALEGLTHAAPERAAALVGPIARDEGAPVVLRVAAMHGAAHVLSPSKLVAQLRPVMRDSRDPGLRSAAADVLARHGKAAGCAAVKAQAGRERDNAGFEKPLERCQ